MAARGGRRSRSRALGRPRYGSRPVGTRRPLPVIVVVCDDARTAVSYFNEVKLRVKEGLTLKVVRNPHDRASAADVVEAAKRQLSVFRQRRSRDEADQTAVWALIDLEGTPDRRRAAQNAKRAGEADGIRVALSDPCYEVWTLLHLVDTGETFINCQAVLQRVAHEWQEKFQQAFPAKAQADYSKIIADRMQAAARAREHHARKDPS